ncbi:HNH endonuclease [Nostoc sp. ChiSLP03a]|uniref:HNH endonuclease n=1 Tax=Nostoc sp. ChiSLP03a TaxID=3075380 RepID=UPI002AD2CF78|nr:HNH endonuclease [Nostoc sp. ChiSLP03a]MDZ8212923.1 HNH endonuclease [Nostoc sp. ChiSLP03a]
MFTRFEMLSRRASELTNCFYCGAFLPAISGEHIFNSSWGGSYKDKNLICCQCNFSFSNSTDKAFLIYVQAVMNSWVFKGERHQEVPKIILENEYFLDQGAKLKLKQPLIEDEVLPDKSIKSRLIFNSKSEAKRWIEGDGIATWLGRTPSAEEKEKLKKIIIEAQLNITDAKPQRTSTQLNLREQYRSTAHTILKCLGFFLPEWVQGDLTKPIREFARYDKGDWRTFAIETKEFFSVAEQATRILGLGVQHNSVEVYWNSSTKMVVGVLTILNRVKRSVVIAQDYSGSDSILYVVKGTHGSKKPPDSVFIEIDFKQFSLPLLSVQYFSSPNNLCQYFRDELAVLMEIYYPIDAITARLIQEIEKNNKKNLKLDQVSLEEYLNLFLSFLLDLGKVVGTSVDMSKARSKLLEYGFANQADQHIGKLYTDPDVEFFMTLAFERIVKDFHAGVHSVG